ncbi:MAG: TonB family protein [Gemmatimonadota bacterium]
MTWTGDRGVVVLEWMCYAVAVAALVGGAALVAERVLRLADRPARWVWTAATLMSLALPAATWTWAGREAVAAEGTAALGVPTVVPTSGVAPSGTLLRLPDLSRFDAPAAAAWGATATLLLLLLGGGALHLSRLRRRWRRAVVGNTVVRVSPRVGPAVVGFLRPEVVVPDWVMAADEETRRWIVDHERQHVHARDPLRLAVSLLPAILLPWNLPMWWQLRRLRQAVELDCDGRVLADAGSSARGRYGRLLLEVARRGGPALPLPAAFAETPSFIERRIRAMSRSVLPVSRSRFAVLGAGAALLLVGACLVPGPDRESPTGPAVDVATEARTDVDEMAREPTFTPYTLAPKLVNVPEVQRALEVAYPPLLRDAGVAGTARVYFFIDADGRVADARIDESSGHEALDRAALEVARTMQFTPALNEDRPVPVWIGLPIAFKPRGASPGPPTPEGGSSGVEAGAPGDPGAAGGDATDEGRSGAPPSFTPFTVAPRLVNESEVQDALEREYPPLLHDAGIGGRVQVFVYVDARGRVQDARVDRSSGHDALDGAAVAVARAMEFEPARNRDEVVPVWVSLPITFQVR